MTSNNEINNNNTDAFASTDAKDDELKVTNLDLNDNDCCYCARYIEDWNHHFNTFDKDLIQENYENCKFPVEYNAVPWTHKDLYYFAKQIQAYETFEKQMDEDLAARAKADDENDWWMDAVDGNNDFNEDANEDNDEYEDWLEAKKEEDMESARQNANEDLLS